MGRFDGRAVIVTGSSNGIGRATAVMFAKEGARVTICGRNEKTLNESKDGWCRRQNGARWENSLLVVQGDICEDEIMKGIVSGTIQKFGRLDVLV
ncbi:hypothetical protein COOONC_16388 [Cooperia oncophora]